MSIAIGIILGLSLLILALSPRVCPWPYARLIFAPVKASSYKHSRVSGIEPENVFLKSGFGVKLHGWFYEQAGAKSLILLSHSNYGNVGEWRSYVAKLLATGSSVFVYDYRGYGMSTGWPTIRGVCRDGLTAYDYLTQKRGIPAERIVLMGCSLGGGVTCAIASKRQCRAMILHGTFFGMRELAMQFVPVSKYLPEAIFFRPAMNNGQTLSAFRKPVLIVHGQNDEVISVGHAQANFAHASSDKELVVLPNSAHLDTQNDAALFQGALTKFMQRVEA